MRLYQEERLMAILEHLQRHARITVQEICGRFGVSRDTARRDIVTLHGRGAIARTHGGAILLPLHKQVYAYADRLRAEPAGKRAIGRLAAALVAAGDHVIMDASTTVQFAAEALTAAPVTAVTNSIDIADILSRKDGVTVHLLGGTLQPAHRFLYGGATVAQLAECHADKVFLGACGIAADGLTYPDQEEGYVIREMIRRADQVCVLADRTKFGKRMFHRVASLDAIDTIITDRAPEGDLLQALRQSGIAVRVADGERKAAPL